jgi:hypothetical protein
MSPGVDETVSAEAEVPDALVPVIVPVCLTPEKGVATAPTEPLPLKLILISPVVGVLLSPRV